MVSIVRLRGFVWKAVLRKDRNGRIIYVDYMAAAVQSQDSGREDTVKDRWKWRYRKCCCLGWRLVTRGYAFMLKVLRMLPRQGEGVGDKVVWLTFDDGPGPYTERLLNVLDRYNAKASFFVLRTSEHLPLLNRMVEKGHTLGNHTDNHVYTSLYSSEESFFASLCRAESRIEAQSGVRPVLVRFPGGSESIRLFSKEAGLDRRLTRAVQERGYQYVDWDLDCRDTVGVKTPWGIHRNVTRGLRGRTHTVVLLHDIKNYTVEAVELILIWGLRRGYVFLPLDETSPTVHHKLD